MLDYFLFPDFRRGCSRPAWSHHCPWCLATVEQTHGGRVSRHQDHRLLPKLEGWQSIPGHLASTQVSDVSLSSFDFNLGEGCLTFITYLVIVSLHPSKFHLIYLLTLISLFTTKVVWLAILFSICYEFINFYF